MKLTGKYSIECNKCGKSYDYTADDIAFVISDRESTEGNEWYVWEKTFNCVKCGNHIHIKYEVCLSPDNQVVDKGIELDGAKQTDDSFQF